MDGKSIAVPQPRHSLVHRTGAWAGGVSESAGSVGGWRMALYRWPGRFQMTPQWLTALARIFSEPLLSHVQDGNLVPGRGAQR